MSASQPRNQPGILHTVEEATDLLRRCEARTWVWWFAGSAPFAVGMLHFVSDMSRAARAEAHLPGAALLLALLYWWMKIAQAVFSDQLLQLLRGEAEPPPLPLRGRLRLITSQALIHFSAPWILPLALLALLPFSWVYASYQNCSVLALSVLRQGGRVRDLIRAAVRQSHYAYRQNHALLLILLIFSTIVWLNWHGSLLLGASLAKSFTGVENAISRNPFILLSSGLISATVVMSYLLVGPLVKALYVLRCFYSFSRKNGEDLAVAFRRSRPEQLARSLAIGFWLAWLPCASAEMPPPVPAQTQIAPAALEKGIQQVLEQDVFQWRMPRARQKLSQDASWLERFLVDAVTWVKRAMHKAGSFLEDLFTEKLRRWLDSLREKKLNTGENGRNTWAELSDQLLKGLIVVLGAGLLWLLVRHARSQPRVQTKAGAGPAAVNLESEQVVATQMPEDEWLRLAEEKLKAGELRLSMRALFLATLAHLNQRQLLLVGRSKSNGDYVRELSLRARGRSELQTCFGEAVRHFDRAWYGWHEVTREGLEQFRAHYRNITTDGRPG